MIQSNVTGSCYGGRPGPGVSVAGGGAVRVTRFVTRNAGVCGGRRAAETDRVAVGAGGDAGVRRRFDLHPERSQIRPLPRPSPLSKGFARRSVALIGTNRLLIGSFHDRVPTWR